MDIFLTCSRLAIKVIGLRYDPNSVKGQLQAKNKAGKSVLGAMQTINPVKTSGKLGTYRCKSKLTDRKSVV